MSDEKRGCEGIALPLNLNKDQTRGSKVVLVISDK